MGERLEEKGNGAELREVLSRGGCTGLSSHLQGEIPGPCTEHCLPLQTCSQSPALLVQLVRFGWPWSLGLAGERKGDQGRQGAAGDYM